MIAAVWSTARASGSMGSPSANATALLSSSGLLAPGRGGTRSPPQPREVGRDSLRFHLKERLGPGQPWQAVSAQTAEADPDRRRPLDRGPGLLRDDDLATVGRPADP